MPELRFPSDRVVGELDWAGAPIGGVPATGRVVVPDGVRVDLTVPGFHDSPGGGRPLNPAVDLGFVRDLPPDGIEALHIRAAHEESLVALAHLAPGLRRLYLIHTEFTDAALPAIAQLDGLVYLQAWGNAFTDAGVQQLVALQNLESLYLEEETLTAAAFAFTDRLPRLARLGLQDVDVTEADIEELRRRLPNVDVG